MTTEQAISHIKPGDRAVVTHATGESNTLINAIVKNTDVYCNVEIVHMVAMGKGEYCPPGYTESFCHNSLSPGASTRDAITKGRGDFTPVYSSQIPGLLREGLHPSVALLHPSPPDEHGCCSHGVSTDHAKPAAGTASLRIAQINSSMPRTLGDSFIRVSELGCIVEVDDPIVEPGQAKIGEAECAIGEHCASPAQDGDCLQLGIDAIPNTVLLSLKEKKDLGIYSGMFSDSVVELVETDVITNRRKTLHKGQYVVTSPMGNKCLHDYVNNNPSVAMYPVDYVNNPAVVAKNDNLVSINPYIQVNLMDQVASDSIGPRQLFGIDGRVDFVRGTNLSRGGKSTMAMPSPLIKRDDTRASKIAIRVDTGAAVTTSHYGVNYIVTKFGVAKLKDETLRNRAKAFIGVIHPDFREELMEGFYRRSGI